MTAELIVEGVTVRFDRRARPALDDVSFRVAPGATLGIVGESGSGKSTMAKAIIGSVPVESGTIRLDGADLGRLRGRAKGQLRRAIQMIPQNPYSSLNPRRTIGAAIAEAIDPWGRVPRSRLRPQIVEWLGRVHLHEDAYGRYPHEFSGGQRQRVAIARALAVTPRVVIADEITSALDATVQKEILALVAELQESLGFTMLFISHDLAVVQAVSDEVLVLFRGDLVEIGSTQQVFQNPESDYTRALLAAIPGMPGFSIR